MGGRKDGEKGGGEHDVDHHHFSVVSTKLLGALALVAVIVGIGIAKYMNAYTVLIIRFTMQVWFVCKLAIISLCYYTHLEACSILCA